MDRLLETLTALRGDPSRAIDLYRQLYQASFFALVKNGSEDRLESHLFLTYPTPDEILELPVFTLREFVLEGLPEEALLIEINGPRLWPRILEIVETGRCEVAVDPGQPHGIRLTREMILGMTVEYGESDN
jgi:SseB protein N-terminal domain